MYAISSGFPLEDRAGDALTIGAPLISRAIWRSNIHAVDYPAGSDPVTDTRAKAVPGQVLSRPRNFNRSSVIRSAANQDLPAVLMANFTIDITQRWKHSSYSVTPVIVSGMTNSINEAGFLQLDRLALPGRFITAARKGYAQYPYAGRSIAADDFTNARFIPSRPPARTHTITNTQRRKTS